MEKLIEKLTNPFDGLKENNASEFQKECAKIAKDLFDNYCILCDNKKYFFAEIEFYYYNSNLYLQNKEQFKWQRVTYPRKCKAKQLFYHLSGVDICFESDYDEQIAQFGGILIRAIKKDDIIIAGPLNCKDEILNACNGGKMPELFELEATKKIGLTPKATYRALGKDDTDIENDRLCFYDSQIKINDWNPIKEKYNTKKGEIEPSKSTYKTYRFYE